MNKYEIYAAVASALTYDTETGRFIWTNREGLTQGDRLFNKRYAGRECGRINSLGYRTIGFTCEGSSRQILAHRLAWFIVHRKLPDGDIDHINRNRADNCIANLRDVPHSINLRNASMQRNNTSGVTGVCWNKATGKWLARAMIDGGRFHLGHFTCIHEAESAIKAFRAKHGYTKHHGEAE